MPKPVAKFKASAKANPAAVGGAAFLAAIGGEVRRNRAKRGMTRRQLAQASETSERYLAQIESGAGNPSVSVLRAIARALDLPASALLPETGARPVALTPPRNAGGRPNVSSAATPAAARPASGWV